MRATPTLRIAVLAVAFAGAILVCLTDVFSATARPQRTAAFANRACPAVAVLASRGSGDTLGKDNGLSAPGKLFASQLADLVGDVRPWANPYHAVGVFSLNLRKFGPQLLNGIGGASKLSGLGLGAYHDSVLGGEQALRRKLADLAANCGRLTAVVLVGYSQGAQVTADVYQRDLTATEKRMVVGSVLFGDTYFNRHDKAVDRGSYSGRRGGLFGERPIFHGSATVLSFCHSHDPICQGVGERVGPIPVIDPGSLTFRQHTNYDRFGEPREAAVALSKLSSLLAFSTVAVRPDGGFPAKIVLAGTRFGDGTRQSTAVALFGRPDSCHEDGGPYQVVARWAALGVTGYTDTLGLAAPGFQDGCRTPDGTFVSALRLDGHRWRTPEGLRPGDNVAKLRALYPSARPAAAAAARQLDVDELYPVGAGPCVGGQGSCDRVFAAVRAGHVAFLQLYVGGQGD